MIEGFDFRNPDYTSVLSDRSARLQHIRANPDLLPGLRSFYRENVAQFICDWGCTSDPRNAELGRPVVIPFIPFPRQVEWIDWIIDTKWKAQESGLTEKSRDMGISWLSVAVSCTLCMFYKDLSIGFGSRKEEYVDKIGDPKSLFYKARQFMDLLPDEFSGSWRERQHSSHMIIKFPATGSVLTGEAGSNIGRGNRTSIYFKDESAFYEQPEKIDNALSETSNCKIDVSTPNGVGNPFYKKRFGGKIDVFTFRWQQDPRKDQAWYDKKCDELSAVTVAQELDIDYSASVSGVLIPGEYVQAAINLQERIGLLPSGIRRVGLDVADEEGKDCNVAICMHGASVIETDEWNGVDTTQTARKANAFAMNTQSTYVNYDSIGVGAGVRGGGKSLQTPFYPVNAASTEMTGKVVNNDQILNKDYYKNLRAKLCWELRIRFERAYEHVNEINVWSMDQMISIPNHPTLVAELSQPLFFYGDGGKIQIESKKDMKKRGVDSPNYFDALYIATHQPKIKRAVARKKRGTKSWT